MNRKLFLIGCTTIILQLSFFVLPSKSGEDSSLKQDSLKLLKVPMTSQATDYTCGASALQSVMAYYGDDFLEKDLARALKSKKKNGTAYRECAKFALSKGYKVEIKKNMSLDEFKNFIDDGIPVICLIQAWAEKKVDYSSNWENGHYVVGIGYDKDRIYFMDPSTIGNYTYIETAEFLERWHDTDGREKLEHFGMLISKLKPVYDPARIVHLG